MLRSRSALVDVRHMARGTPASTDSCDAVRDFYESHPYPEPLADLERHRELYRNPDRRRAWRTLLWPTGKPRASREILVAGCGTSQAAIYALREPAAHVTGIDISDASLRHTLELQHKYSLRNLDLHRLAIEEVGGLGRAFDQIVCTGVLHHLEDPDLGLRALSNVLAPDGAMQLMVYAAYGRTGIYMMQEYCRLLRVSPTAEDLRDMDAMIGSLSAEHPISGVSRKTRDFSYPAALADALLHPRDRAYTVPQLYAWLERSGLKFGRWLEQAPYLPQCGAITRMPHAARLASLPLPMQHAAVELLRGTMTRHSFIAYRGDGTGQSQSISFEGKSWHSYIPVRLPWTLSIREGVPHGFSAVVINPTHSYPDLALPIDATRERILMAIDGRRPVEDILRRAKRGIGEEQGGRFIQQLWDYDQIAIDATETR